MDKENKSIKNLEKALMLKTIASVYDIDSLKDPEAYIEKALKSSHLTPEKVESSSKEITKDLYDSTKGFYNVSKEDLVRELIKEKWLVTSLINREKDYEIKIRVLCEKLDKLSNEKDKLSDEKDQQLKELSNAYKQNSRVRNDRSVVVKENDRIAKENVSLYEEISKLKDKLSKENFKASDLQDKLSKENFKTSDLQDRLNKAESLLYEHKDLYEQARAAIEREKEQVQIMEFLKFEVKFLREKCLDNEIEVSQYQYEDAKKHNEVQ